MKKVIFIGNRLNVVSQIKNFEMLDVVRVYVQEDSLLHKSLSEADIPTEVEIKLFTIKDKTDVINSIASTQFDILISNGCPIILPVLTLRKSNQIFVNIHPTLLPDLKGKTPLNGVFMTHRKEIGATMHYIDAGIDTGDIIAQAKTEVTPDLDQGLVYKISFDLEKTVFNAGIQKIIDANYAYSGIAQTAEGSYFNRTTELQQINFQVDDTDKIYDKIKSFGIKGQGSYLTIGGVTYRAYSAEKILNKYILDTYASIGVGEVAFEYDNKFIIRTVDGMIKITDLEIVGEQ